MKAQPALDEAQCAVWAAYEALDEKQKRAITRYISKSDPKFFKYWVKIADLDRGCDQRKVVHRGSNYGSRLDKVLKEHKNGDFGAEVFAKFLMKFGSVDDILSGIADNVDAEDFDRLVDEKAAETKNEYANFAAVFLKCYRHKDCEKYGVEDAPVEEMTGIIEQLNKHAIKIEDWALSLRLTEYLPKSEVTETVEAANRDVERLTKLMHRYRETLGLQKREFKTPAEVSEHVKEICAALSAKNIKEEVAGFLRSLADALRLLKVTHRSVKEQTRLSSLRDKAAYEVQDTAKAEEPNWAYETNQSGDEWLLWAFDIGGDELEEAQGQLKCDGYKNLSEFIGLGDAIWISDLSTREKEGNRIDDASHDDNGPRDITASELVGVEQIKTKNDDDVETPVTESDIEFSAKTIEIETLEPEEEASVSAEICTEQAVTSDEDNVDCEPVNTNIIDTEPVEFDEDEDPGQEPCDTQPLASSLQCDDIQEMPKIVTGTGEKATADAIASLAAKLAHQGEYALAYHLQSNAALVYDMQGTIPAWVFGCVACGRAIQGTDQSANSVLLGFFQHYKEQMFDELKSSDRMATRLMLAAGGIEPALFFPITGAASVLQTLHLNRLPEFHALVKAVAEYGSRGVGLPRSALFSTISADALKQKREALQAKAKEWLVERAPQFDIISRPGKDTWRAWIAKSGPVGSMLSPLIVGQTDAIPEIRALAEKYADPTAIDQEARRLFRHELQHRGELLRPTLNMVRRHTTEAIDIVNEWISVVESHPDNNRQRFDEKMLTQLRKHFADHTKQAITELECLSENSRSIADRAGSAACIKVVNDVARMLTGNGTQSESLRNAHRLLHDDLLRIWMLQLDEDGLPRLPDYSMPTDHKEAVKELARKVVNDITTCVTDGLPVMQAAARMRGEIGDHASTDEIMEILKGIDPTSDNLKRLEQERANSVTKHKESSRNQLKLGQRALSDALTKGLFSTQEYERWAVQLESAEQDMRSSGFLRFSDVFALCERLKIELGDRKTTEIARLRKEIDRINPSREYQVRLDTVLSGGDVHTATDYIDRISNQIELPDMQESEAASFIQFFGKGEESSCAQIERELKDANSVSSFINRVSNRNQVSGLQLSEMQTTQAKESADFLQLWFRTKTSRELKEQNGSNIFSFFGMRPKRMVKLPLSKSGGHNGDVWDLQVEPLGSREVCPCAGFGSAANGHYKVIGYWGRPAAEDILQHAKELGGGPLIVLYFGRIGMSERRRLAAERGRGAVLVIDDILAVFLAGQRKGRLLSLFLCSLPFSHISLYTKTASLLPPEMFYGRHREIRQLVSNGTDSSCLLYGGRQIGKTVLLRHVQRLFERDEPSTNVATYIDLNDKEIGKNRPMDDVWLVIAEELAKKKVITGEISRQTKHDWLFARIEEWLTVDTKRRILVLLDEADDFLSADAKGQDSKAPFSACTVLKGLMERTNRRFKLVFAGLHNVQKSTKVSNNPLAHFGEPICIGAMTDAGESREAEALIKEPLAAVGYFFESADLPARILAQTNYYPNLIQIYCDELLKYIQQRSRVLFPSEKTPPYFIGAKILEDVYERHELREELRLRFKWTLELDRRFELIANILALNDADCTRGLEIAEIQSSAQLYWDRGFYTNDGKPMNYEGFRDLLEEMVGLGILRRAEPPGHYALRNPNVLNLIGSRNAVEKLLEDSHKWDPVVAYDPTKFRGQISEYDKSLRSPLDAAQESKLKSGSNQVYVVCGCPAGHVDKVEVAISYRFGKEGFVKVLQGHENLSHFQSELSNLGNRKSGGTTLIVIPDSVRWDRNWVLEASKRISRFKKTKGAICVVFVTGPNRLFSIVPDMVRRKFDGVNFTSVQPWDNSTVNHWLQEGGYSAVDASVRAKLSNITGNWPVLLEEALKYLNSNIDDTEKLEMEIKEAIYSPERKSELYNLFGLMDAAMSPLKFLCDNGPGWSIEEISGLIETGENISAEHVSNVLTWAALLGIARRGPDGWAIDAVVRQVLLIG